VLDTPLVYLLVYLLRRKLPAAKLETRFETEKA
jgi:hypothetical protein